MANHKYPEHVKLEEFHDDMQAQGEILEWLGSQHITLCIHQERRYCCPKCWWISEEQVLVVGLFDYRCRECESEVDFEVAGYCAITKSIEDLLAEMHEIDQKKFEREKREMLEALRA